ncbi:MAG: hypothetical protein FJZ59_07560 [Chlamydiae bacterium]|nr:hypothetical protein [Chlamydiota bacterium]
MSTNKSKKIKKEKMEDFLRRANLAVESVSWLEKQVNYLVNKIDELDDQGADWNDELLKQKENLVKQLAANLKKVDLETKTIDSLEAEIVQFLSNEKEKPKKKVNRKKPNI